MRHITKAKTDLSIKDTIHKVLNEPRIGLPFLKQIQSDFTSTADFLNWYYDTYIPAYTKIFKEKWRKSKTPDDCVKLLPNITPWAFKDKGNSLGHLPDTFGNKEDFAYLLNNILASDAIAKYREIKTLELSQNDLAKVFPLAHKINFQNLSQRADFLHNLLKQETSSPFIIKTAKHIYKVTTLCNPFTKKIVCQININEEEYILKLSHNNIVKVSSEHQQECKENQLLRADSPYVNALVDFYLSYNNCPNAADICYYNFDYDCALYKKNKGTFPKIADNVYSFNHKHLADANLLGVFMNDINSGNFIKDEQTSTLKIIDSGHVSYSNPANQGIAGIGYTLGNLCGYEITNTFGALLL